VLADTHAHLDLEDFKTDRDDVIRRAADAGVGFILNPGINTASTQAAIALADRYAIVHVAAGIHPNETARARPGDMNEIRRIVQNERVVAIGETGLDFYRDRAPRETQLRYFLAHLELAAETGLPVIIHFRNVGYDGIELAGVERFAGIRGVFHCFSGSREFARKVIGMDFHLGFDGPLTYPGSDRPGIVRDIPADRILIETDCPFLTPQSHRGTRNEPAYVAEVAGAIAVARGIAPDKAADLTWRNACELFGNGGR